MNLLLTRTKTSDGCTLGQLFMDGAFFCFTLEPDEDRPNHPAIPVGTYKVIVYPSPKFHRMVPQIVNVPGRQYIEIHPGNTEIDTDGCILLGMSQTVDAVQSSRAACELFQSKIAPVLAAGETVTIQVTDPEVRS